MKKITVFLLFAVPAILYIGCKQDVETPVEPPPVVNPTQIFSATLGSGVSDLITGAKQTNDGGIVICGYTIASAFGDNDIFIAKINYNGTLGWANLYGGSGNDQALSLEKTGDGGFIICGASNTFSGSFDPITIKLDGSGNLQWSKYYRWLGEDYANNITPTSDGGYILTGYSNSFGAGENDIYSLKIDQSGGIMWCRCYGGAFSEYGNSIKETSDAGYIIGGYTFSFGNFGEGYIIKLWGDGGLNWSKTYGGIAFDNIKDLQRTTNGYIACGSTASFGLVTEDGLIFNIDNSGFVYFAKTFGGAAGGLDQLTQVKQTTDGGFVASGYVTTNNDGLNMSLLRLYGDGAFNWEKSFGGVSNDVSTAVSLKSDGGFLLAGATSSFGAGANDIYVLSLKNDGTGCLTDNPANPNAGAPTLEITTPATVYFDVNFFETNTAAFSTAQFNVVQNTQCVINP